MCYITRHTSHVTRHIEFRIKFRAQMLGAWHLHPFDLMDFREILSKVSRNI